jgi:predicted AlkP superfamily pyrophosphatase or phosphodiesterase
MTSMTRLLAMTVAFTCGLTGCASRSAQPSGNGGPSPVAGTKPGQTAANTAPPKLVVLLAVDQLRGDYLELYGGGFTAGLKRLTSEGAWFTRAAFPYLNTVTCAGHATIGTGTLPYRHGMILNQLYDRAAGTSPYCTVDPAVKDIALSHVPPAAAGNSAARLLQPTLGDAIKGERKGRIVSVSLKPRSAITLAGREADAVAWFDERGGWMTTPALSASLPLLQAYIAAHPPEADAGKVWERLRPIDAYQKEDAGIGEKGTGGWSATFPHPLGKPGTDPLGNAGAADDRTFYTRWQASPYADDHLGRMAVSLFESLRLGRGETTDLLAVSFSSLDMVGHNFGPRSHEVQDMLFRLDATIGRLLEALDAALGKDGYVLGLSADHGVAEIPEQVPGAGRIVSSVVREALQKGLAAALGPGEHVASVNYTDLYLKPEAARRVKEDPKVFAAARDALLAVPGIAQVLLGDELRGAEARRSTDRVRRAAALSYHPERSGDLIVVPRETWLQSTAATTHGTLYRYDQHVPVILYGPGVKAGRYEAAATPADLAPTLAALAGVTFRTEDGRVLGEAMASSGGKLTPPSR